MFLVRLSEKSRRRPADIIGSDIVKDDDNTWIVHWLLGDDSIIVKSDKFTSRLKANEYVDDILKQIEDYLIERKIYGSDEE